MSPEGVGADTTQEEIAALREQLMLAQEAVRARDEFLAVAAHELRNPMHIAALAVGTLMSLAKRKADPEMERMAARASRAMSSLARQSNLLLDISRLNAGRFALHPLPLDLVACVRGLLAELQEQAMHLGCELRLDAPGQILGHWDPQAVSHLVGNLVGNAIKYGAGHPVQVTLARAGDGTVLLTVSDEGPGIPPEAQRRIFEKFERVVAATPTAAEGFGLGLWIVGRIVQAHGGRVEVHSEPGRGSSFTVALPPR